MELNQPGIYKHFIPTGLCGRKTFKKNKILQTCSTELHGEIPFSDSLFKAGLARVDQQVCPVYVTT